MTRLRLRLLHCINLRRSLAGKVIFYCVCQSLINPCTSSILTERRRGRGVEGEGEEDSSISSVLSPLSVLCPVFILFVSIPCFSSCLPSGYLLFHLPHANTHFLFSLFFFSFTTSPHGGPHILPQGAHFRQTVMNGPGSCIDFQTETI